MAASSHHVIHSLDSGSSKQAVFVIFVNISFVEFKSFLHLWIVHLESTITISFTQYKSKSFTIATQAAQTQLTTILISSFFFQVIFKELINQARQTIAVQCWSSWNTGILSSAFNLSSISKHLGAEKSSKFIHQTVGEICLIVFIISSVSCVLSTIGNALTHANSLNNTHFHSITGSQASHPIFPSQSTALQSETTITVLDFIVYL